MLAVPLRGSKGSLTLYAETSETATAAVASLYRRPAPILRRLGKASPNYINNYRSSDVIREMSTQIIPLKDPTASTKFWR